MGASGGVVVDEALDDKHQAFRILRVGIDGDEPVLQPLELHVLHLFSPCLELRRVLLDPIFQEVGAADHHEDRVQVEVLKVEARRPEGVHQRVVGCVSGGNR